MPSTTVAETLERGRRVLGGFPAPERALYESVWELHAWGLDLDLTARALGRRVDVVSAILARLQGTIADELTGPLMSVGYEGRDLTELVNLLVEHDVNTVVDVRLNAISRRRGFSKTSLSDALGAAGIAYIHERELGNPKDNRAPFHAGDLDLGRARFFELLEAAHGAVDRVMQLMSQARIALLCFERDHAQCHRACIVERVSQLNPSVPVVHL